MGEKYTSFRIRGRKASLVTDYRLGTVKVKTWRRKWQPTPVLLPGKLMEEPDRLKSMVSQRVRHN